MKYYDDFWSGLQTRMVIHFIYNYTNIENFIRIKAFTVNIQGYTVEGHIHWDKDENTKIKVEEVVQEP